MAFTGDAVVRIVTPELATQSGVLAAQFPVPMFSTPLVDRPQRSAESVLGRLALDYSSGLPGATLVVGEPQHRGATLCSGLEHFIATVGPPRSITQRVDQSDGDGSGKRTRIASIPPSPARYSGQGSHDTLYRLKFGNLDLVRHAEGGSSNAHRSSRSTSSYLGFSWVVWMLPSCRSVRYFQFQSHIA